MELARLLIGRGEGYWDEAERLLRQAVERNPGGEHPRTVLAELLAQRGHTADTESGPAELPGQRFADSSLSHSADQSGNGVDSAGVGTLLVDGGDGVGDGLATTPLPAALDELAHRGRLAGEFTRARLAGIARPQTVSTEWISREARRGDPLAGFYSQWLMPDETPECPPHAWAWRACRYWQESAQPDRWRDMAKEFPEAARETDFLRILATSGATDDGEDRSGAGRWRARHGSDGDTPLPPLVKFMRRELERIGEIKPDEREELASTVMAGKAADVPEFTPQPA